MQNVKNGVIFKGTANGLVIVLDDEMDFDAVLSSIEDKLSTSGKFFKGASINVKYRGRKLIPEQEKKIIELMVNKTGVQILGFEFEDYKVDNNEFCSTNEIINVFNKKPFFTGIYEGKTKFVKGTLRSGQLVQFEGNIVILGDVNPGAEIMASGNIVVMGTLRGVAHAGADGNKDAFVAALNLHPSLLRIADVIARSPDEYSGSQNIPEIAFVKDDSIIIETFLPNKS